MAQAAVKDTTGYVNYVYNISARGTTEVASQLLGLSGMATNILGQLAFQTSSYLSTTEGALLSMGVIATAGFTKATKQAMEFDQALSTVGAISGKTRGEVASLGDDAMAMSSKFGVAVSEMTQGMESLARAGVSQGNMTAILEEAMGLSKLEGLTLDTAINDLISTTNLLDTQGLDLSSPEYAEAVKYQNQKITATSEAAPINAQDIIHTLEHIGGYASSTNLDQDDLYAVIAQLGSKGTKSEMAGTSLRAFISAGQKDTAQRALNRIGLNVKDLWKNDDTIMSITDMKDVLDEAMESRGYTQQEKLEFYSDFAGYKQANQIMKIDTQSAREFKEKIDHSWNMGQKIGQIIGTAETHVQGLVQAGTNLLTKVGEPFLPIISTIAWTLRTGIDMINAIPGSNLIIAGGLILASVKAISTIFNKIVPQIVAAKGNIGSMGGFFGTIKKDLKESYTIIKNINNTDWIQRQAHINEVNHITDDDKKRYWQHRTGKRLYGMTDVYRLEKRHGFTNDQHYIDWKRRENYKTKESRNERHETQNEPTSATESSNNRKDNKKSDCCDLIVQAIKDVHSFLKSGNVVQQKFQVSTNDVKIDDSIIKDLKSHVFQVSIVDDKSPKTKQNIKQKDSSSRLSHKESDVELRKKYGGKANVDDFSDFSLLDKGVLSKQKIDDFVDMINIDFGFDTSTTEGRKSQEFMQKYAKDLVKANLLKGEINLTGQSSDRLKQRIENELHGAVFSFGENNLGSIVASMPDTRVYSSSDLERINTPPKIDYDPSLKNKSDVLKDLDLDYNRITRSDNRLKGGGDFLSALATLGGIDVTDINTREKGGIKYRSKMAQRIKDALDDDDKYMDLNDSADILRRVLSSQIAYHYMYDLSSEQQKDFMKSVGIERSSNAYVDMAKYLQQFEHLNNQTPEKDLELIQRIGNIAELDKDKMKVTDGFSAYGRDFQKGQNVKNKIDPATEKTLKMIGEEGFKGVGIHIKKITDAIVELTIQNGISELKKEMEQELGRRVSVAEVINNMPNLHIPHRLKILRHSGDIDDVGKTSIDNANLHDTIWGGAQSLHDSQVGGNEKWKTATKNGGFETLQRAKFVANPNDENVIFEDELSKLKNMSFHQAMIGLQTTETRKALAETGTSDIQALPYIFEGTQIGGIFKRLPTHNRDMLNTAVLKSSNYNFDKNGNVVDQNGNKILDKYGNPLTEEIPEVLAGYLQNDKGDYREAYSWALERRRNRYYMQDKQKQIFAHIGLKYGLSREDVMNQPLTQLQKNKVKDLYYSQEFVNINDFVQKYDRMYNAASPDQQKNMMTGEQALRQLRGQMAAARKIELDSKGNVVDNGGIFETYVTPEEYERRLKDNLIYTGEGDKGILEVKKDKKDPNNILYKINDFEALHYSKKDLTRKVMLEDTLWAHELAESYDNLMSNQDDYGVSVSNDNLMNFVSIVGEKDMSAKDIAEKMLAAPTEKLKTLANAIYLYNEDLYDDVISELKLMFKSDMEVVGQIPEIKKAKQQTNINSAFDLLYKYMPDAKDLFSQADIEHIASSRDPFSEAMGVLSGMKKVDPSIDIPDEFLNTDTTDFFDSGEYGGGTAGVEDYGKIKGISEDFNSMIAESMAGDYNVNQREQHYNTLIDLLDEETAEMMEAISGGGEYLSELDMVVMPRTDDSVERALKAKMILSGLIEKGEVSSHKQIKQQYESMQGQPLDANDLNLINQLIQEFESPITSAPLSTQALQLANMDYKETTPGGDEEPTVIDVDDFGMPGMSFNSYGGFNIGKEQFDTNKDMREQYIKQFYTAIDNNDIYLLEESLNKLVIFDKEYEAYRTVLNRINGLDERKGLAQNGVKSLKSLLIPDIRNTRATTIIGTGTFLDDDKLNTYKNQVKKQNAYKSAVHKDIGEEDEWMFGQPYSTMQVNGVNIDPNSTDWNQVGEALKEGQKRAQENATSMENVGDVRFWHANQENYTKWLQTAFEAGHFKDTGATPMPGSISGADYSTIKLINETLGTNARSIGGYQTAGQLQEIIQQKLNNFVSSKVDTIYNKFGDRDNSDITGKLDGWSDKLTNATDTLQGFSVYLQEASELFPPLSVAVLGLETVITTITKINEGSQALSSFLDIGKSLKAGETFEFLGQTFSSNTNAGKMLMSATGMVGEAVETLTTIFWEFLGPITLITAGLIAIKGALDWSYQSHKKYLESLEEEQKEHRSRVKGLQATNENAQKTARENRAPRQQAAFDRNAQLAQTRLDNANMTRSHGAIEITRQKNDTLWGDYGISAGLSKISGNYESTASEYEGTTEQTRKIKEATLANPFSSDAMNQVSAYYDANQLAFGIMDEYKDELGKLYDAETSAMLKYHSDDVRESPEFNKALDDFVEATGITRDHAKQYLDYMQTEHEVDRATQTMQAQADQIAASTELKVQAIAFGGNPADVLGLNGIEAQQDSMIKAQADMIKMELSGQLWWKAVWSTITTPIKLILSPIFIIVDLLNAIWSLMTGNIGGAFESGGRAASRLNVFGEAATYWGAWAETEGTDFNAIGQSATDSYNRANYGNVEQPASGGYHPTHYLNANQGQDRREAFTHYTDANRGSYHFMNGGGPGESGGIQFNPLGTITGLLSSILGVLVNGLLIGGGIYGLTKLLKSDFNFKDLGSGILSTIRGEGSNLLGNIFNIDGIKGGATNVLSKFFNLDGIKGLGSSIKDKLSLDMIKNSGIYQKVNDMIPQGAKDAYGNWSSYIQEKINPYLPSTFNKKKRKGMNAADRAYLVEKYGLQDLDLEGKDENGRRKYRTADQKNKAIRDALDEQGNWDSAMRSLQYHNTVGQYTEPWKEYLGGKVDEKKQQAQDYWKNLQVDAAAYYERPDLFEDASSPVKAMAKAYEIKDQIFGKASKTDFSGLLNDPKEFLSDPRNIENMAKDLYAQHKDKIAGSDFMATVGAYRERPDIMEDTPIHAKLMGKALDWKDKYLQGDSIQDVLKDPERTVGILQGTWNDLQGGALDDLNIGETVKDKVSGFFNDIKEGAEEGIDDEDGDGGNGGLIERAKKKLAGFFGFGKEEGGMPTQEEMDEKEKSGDFTKISDWKKDFLHKQHEEQGDLEFGPKKSFKSRLKDMFGKSDEETPMSNISKSLEPKYPKYYNPNNMVKLESPGAFGEAPSVLDLDGLGDVSDNLKTGGKIAQKAGGFLKGKGGKLGKVGNVLNKVGGGASKAGAKGIGGMAKGGIGKAAKGGIGKLASKGIGKVGSKLAAKGIAQVGSKVLGGALIASGIGAPLGLLLESPIGGMLIEGAMDLGGKALGAVGGAIGGAVDGVKNFLGFGKKSHYQQAGGGIGGGLGAMGGLGMMAIAGPIGMGVGLLGSIFKTNKDQKNNSQNIGDIAKNILKNIVAGNNKPNNNGSGGNITIHNININTADDPEAIKAMFLELLIELQEQVNPRLVSRTVGEPPAAASSTTPTDTTTTDPNATNTNDPNATTNNNNNNTTTNN